ncbi:polysaccharide lyase family 8 super-sandwich domain-containing protein [Paenibacillus sp. Soil766]|uniref:polysaccharide lyase family 8 super-sandwich domain-containing protein n=1 Tax=Paenibacillus sp. Soil766 TaxID=1736404 RepID=UPI00070C7CDD|nr:polysaccharide lyase family 8 super-sandwich domain-containing protein [Paenibacillus sp. Soil766]
MIKRSISSVICVMMMFSLLVGVLPQPSYAASGPWDLLNDNLSNFTSTGWTEQRTTGFTGSVTQNTGNVTIVDASDKSTYLLKQPVAPATTVAPASGAFTFEAVAKVNAAGTLNEFTVRGASYLISFYLTYGTSGVVQNKSSNSTKSYTLDTTVYHAYRVVVHSNYTYDLYVDGTLAWSGAPNGTGSSSLIKIGGDSASFANITLDHVRMGTGEILPFTGTITSVSPEAITTSVGTPPVMPAVVSAVYTDESIKSAPVIWENIQASQYAQLGSFTVNGAVVGTAIPAIATITVTHPQLAVTAIQPVQVTTQAKIKPVLPTVVTAVYSDQSMEQRNVQWDTYADTLYAKAGSFDVNGTVAGTSIRAVAHITVTAAPEDEYDTLRNKLKVMLTGGFSYNQQDLDIANQITALTAKAQTNWDSMIKTADRAALWSDLASTSNSAQITSAYTRLKEMAIAYATVGSSLQNNAALLADLQSALDWMYSNRYNENKVLYDNWWDWWMGAPLALNDTVILLYDDLSSTQIANYMNAVEHFTPIVDMTAANRVWKSQVVAYRGIIVKNASKIAMARDGLSPVFVYVTSGDGFYKDGSFIQHDVTPYNGGYGATMLANLADMLYALNGTTWAVTDPKVSNVYQWIYDNFEPFMYKGLVMDMSRGREISRSYATDHITAQRITRAVIRLSQLAPLAHTTLFKSMIKYWIQADTYLNFYLGNSIDYIVLAKNIVQDAGVTPRGEQVSFKQFASMDQAIQRRPAFTFAIRMHSNRIANYESGNNENLKGWFTGDGMTYLYNNDLGQFTDNYWQTVDPYRLPGTTVDRQTRTTGGNNTSGNSWTGGTEILGEYGVSGMELDALYSNLTAKKSWFMFDNEIVSLGSGITSTENRTIETIVDNRKMDSLGDHTFTVNNTAKSAALGWNETMNAVQWAHLAGKTANTDIGYYFPTPATVKGLREARTGSWNQIDGRTGTLTTPFTSNYMTLWFDHGVNPTNGTYQYVTLPNYSSAETGSYASHPDVEILENSTDAQAVKEKSLGIVGANFWNDTTKSIQDSGSNWITSNKKASVMTHKSSEVLNVSISDPTHKNTGSIDIEIHLPANATISFEPGITVTQLLPTIKLNVQTNGSMGKTFHAKFNIAGSNEVPAAPNLTSAVAGHNTVVLNWEPVNAATGYMIKYGTASGNYAETVTVGPVSSTTISGLTSEVPYYFIVSAFNQAGASVTASNERSATPIADYANTWTLENDVLRTKIQFTDDGSIEIGSFFNKAAGREYLPQIEADNNSTLFHYNYRLLTSGETGKEAIGSTLSLDANDTGFVLGTASSGDISMTATDGSISKVGTRLEIPVTKNGITVTLSFELYDGKAGLKYQAYLTNNSVDKRLQITSSDVITLDFPDEARNLHYVYLSKWNSTTGGVDQSDTKRTSEDIKVIINRYNTGDGFYVGPEVNSKTEILKRDPGSPDTGAPYMVRSFAGISAFKGHMVNVATNPEALQLVLFPGEKFEYIAVNLSVFQGDIVDGKMAVEEHLRARFKYNHTSTILNTNDWQWGESKRNEAFYKSVAVPKINAAGFDMFMFDDGWNNANDTGTSRDGVEALPSITNDMKGLADYFQNKGLLLGMWYSMTGGYHNRGNDLADPAVIAAKKEKINYLIDNYHLSHQMVDLTEFWPNSEVTTYSHPTDNVYRKNVLTNHVLNEVVDENPDYMVKYTTEVDIWPSQGDRTNELIHVVDNGWTTATTEYGEDLDIPIFAGLFGHLPLNSVYFNIGNMTTGDMSTYYKYLFARNIKHGSSPDGWSQKSIDLMAKLNAWRNSGRIKELTDSIIRPVYNGIGWDSNSATSWVDQKAGPYVMMQVSPNKDHALMIATGGGKAGVSSVDVNLRWLDPSKQYLIEDISLDDTGIYTYRFKGLLAGEQLKSFTIDLTENSSKGRAYWIQEYTGADYQILYADENVDSSQLSIVDNQIVITGTGKANTSGKVVIYGHKEEAVMLADLSFGATRSGTLRIDQFEVTEDVFIPTLSSATTYVAADLSIAGKTTVSGGTQTVVSSGSTPNASPQGLNFASTATTAGSYIDFKLNVTKAGVYRIQVAAKVNANRGIGQWYVDGVQTGPVWDQKMENGQVLAAEKIGFHTLGDVTFAAAGEKTFRFEFQGGSNKVINTDRFILTPVSEVLGQTSGLAITGEAAVEVDHKVTLHAAISGLHAFYASGDYVKWYVESQNATNGSNKVISIVQRGLDLQVTGVNPGTARLKAMSTVNANVFNYYEVVVSQENVITSITPVNVTTVVGIAPVLPATITAIYRDGTTTQLGVTWDGVNATSYAQAGTFDVQGAISGTGLKAIAHVTVTGGANPDPGTGPGTDPGTGPGQGPGTDPTTNPGTVIPEPEISNITTISEADFRTAFENAKDNKMSFDLPNVQGDKPIGAVIPVAFLDKAIASGITQLAFTTNSVEVKLPVQALKGELEAGAKEIQWTFEEKSSGSGTIYQLGIEIGGEPVTRLDGEAVRVAIAYQLKPGEKPENVVIHHLDDAGKHEVIVNGTYNPVTGKMDFKTNELGTYSIRYANVTFSDLAGSDWAQSSIEALAAREVLNGVGDNKFMPSHPVTRAEFLTMLMRAAGFSDDQGISNFSDIDQADWYFGSVAAAEKLGIISGREDGSFGADSEISRQDMAVMVFRSLQVLNLNLKTGQQGTTFADATDIAGYAAEAIALMQSGGIIEGSDGKFMPLAQATRAQAAVIIQRLVKLNQ